MTEGLLFLIGMSVLFLCYVAFRSYFFIKMQKHLVGYASHLGTQSVQADSGTVRNTANGMLAVLSDGLGRIGMGQKYSEAAVEAMVEYFEEYPFLGNPEYFFQSAYALAGSRIKKIRGDYSGGAGMASVIIKDHSLSYASAGQVKIMMFRNRELMVLSDGHTVENIAKQAFYEGRLSKEKAMDVHSDSRLLYHLGMEREVVIDSNAIPIQLREGDLIVLMTKGIYETIPFREIEMILGNKSMDAKEQAEQVIRFFALATSEEKHNGSIVVIAIPE